LSTADEVVMPLAGVVVAVGAAANAAADAPKTRANTLLKRIGFDTTRPPDADTPS
jgi:hypothetical protein